MAFTASEDDGGLMIDHYELEYSELTVTNWQQASEYDGQSLLFSISSLTPNMKYRFRYRAVNLYGNSLWSPTLDIVVAPLPSQPAAPLRIASSPNSIHLEWGAPSDTEPITGYQLFESISGGDALIFDSQLNPNTLDYTVTGLLRGHSYTFKVVAFNFNGRGAFSASATYWACDVPAEVQAPLVIETT